MPRNVEVKKMLDLEVEPIFQQTRKVKFFFFFFCFLTIVKFVNLRAQFNLCLY